MEYEYQLKVLKGKCVSEIQRAASSNMNGGAIQWFRTLCNRWKDGIHPYAFIGTTDDGDLILFNASCTNIDPDHKLPVESDEMVKLVELIEQTLDAVNL